MGKNVAGMTRREALGVAALGLMAMAGVPAFANADEEDSHVVKIPITDGMTVGDVIALTEPGRWEGLPESVQAALLKAPLTQEKDDQGVMAAADVGGNAWVTPQGSYYNCGYTTSVWCPGIAVAVTYSAGGYIYYNRSFYGSGQNVYGSDTVGLSPGTYNVVATGYPTTPPAGYEVSYSQGFGTAYI